MGDVIPAELPSAPIGWLRIADWIASLHWGPALRNCSSIGIRLNACPWFCPCNDAFCVAAPNRPPAALARLATLVLY